MVENGQTWSKMVKHGQKWSNMAKNGHKWSNMVKHGRTWSVTIGHKWHKLQIWQNGQKRTKWSKDPSGGSSGGPFGGLSGGLSGVRPGFPWEVRPGGLEVGARRAPRLLVISYLYWSVS